MGEAAYSTAAGRGNTLREQASNAMNKGEAHAGSGTHGDEGEGDDEPAGG